MSESSTPGSLSDGIWGDASLLSITSHIPMQISMSPPHTHSFKSSLPATSGGWRRKLPSGGTLGNLVSSSKLSGPVLQTPPHHMSLSHAGRLFWTCFQDEQMKQQSHLHLGTETPTASSGQLSSPRAEASPTLPGNANWGSKQNALFPCVLGFSWRPARNLSRAEKNKKTASFRLKGQVIFLLQSLYSSFRCLGQEKRRISLVSAPFSQISQQFEACISQHRLGYAAVTTTTPPPQISLGSNSKSVFYAHAQCPLNRAQLTGVT